ncbi:GNAT family N-acetyltransferase [Methylosinus sporium]|uniref:GNAT family N-acetyltransferase n=1 Tax=Methylosinus sporium TaxID=428 RepID=A0A2U1SP04_METSR|nr:GNAT family N-acetyltransferase [Methylosinus sporium]PWB93334.1 GNAT family N-acetyltransferase [Methylosinus sporium]
MPSEFSIRAATAEDAPTLAALNLACWRETYEGLLPAETFAALTLEERLDHWRGAFQSSGSRVALAFDVDGAAVGFTHWRAHEFVLGGRLGRGGEICAVYLRRAVQRRGLGRRMMRQMAREMRASGCKWASLVVLRDNLPARRFYEALGGRRFGRELSWRGVPQIAYGWRDVAGLAAHQ